MSGEQSKDFEPLVRAVRRGISLNRNKRLRDALAERGDPQTLLARELPGAVAAEWAVERGPNTPPPSAQDAQEMPREELRDLTRKVARRIERQGDEGEEKIVRAAKRMPAYTDDDEEFERQEGMRKKLLRIAQNAGLSPREMDIYGLTLDDVDIDDKTIGELLGIEPASVTKTRYRMMKKLRESAATQGIRGL